MDSSDPFPNDSSEWKDTDNDGIGNNSDDYPYDASNGKNASKENLFISYESTSFAKGTGEVPLTVLSATELFLNMVKDDAITIAHIDMYYAVLKDSIQYYSGNEFDSKGPKNGYGIFEGYNWGEININDSCSEMFGSQSIEITKENLLYGYTTGTSFVQEGMLSMAKSVISYANKYGYDIDSDGDKRVDSSDPFPDDPTEWSDMDGDNIGDNSDTHPYDAHNGTKTITIGSTEDILSAHSSTAFNTGTGEVPLNVLSASEKFLTLVINNTITIPQIELYFAILKKNSIQYYSKMNLIVTAQKMDTEFLKVIIGREYMQTTPIQKCLALNR